jgi:N-terminal glutamine amidase
MASFSLKDFLTPKKEWIAKDACTYTRYYCEENACKLAEAMLSKGDAIVQSKDYDLFVVFISNENNTVPFWGHRSDGMAMADDDDDNEDSNSDNEESVYSFSSSSPSSSSSSSSSSSLLTSKSANDDDREDTVVWDYHVIVVAKHKSDERQTLVFDFDANELPFPCDSTEYSVYCLGIHYELGGTSYEHRFRVVPARQFVDHFASDRRHMRTADGGWEASPPSYAPIRGASADSAHNLDRFTRFEAGMLQSPAPCRCAVLDRERFFRWIGVLVDLVRDDDDDDGDQQPFALDESQFDFVNDDNE